MSEVRAMGIFCEDFREEMLGLHSLIGVLPDNVNVAAVPALMPKLTLYVRIAISHECAVNEMAVVLMSPSGENLLAESAIETVLIERAKAEAAINTTFGTIVHRATISPFPIQEYGRVKLVVRADSKEIVCGALNFANPETTLPVISSSLEQRPSAKRSRGARKKKAKKP
jgi:hypothetical protein